MGELLTLKEIGVRFNEPLKDKVLGAIEKLDALCQEYYQTSDLRTMETLKRQFNAELNYLAKLHSDLLSWKGPNHIYLEEIEGRFRAQTFDMLEQEKVGPTRAKEVFKNHPFYAQRMDTVIAYRKFFIKVEKLYGRYNEVLRSLVQSISIEGKEFENSKHAE